MRLLKDIFDGFMHIFYPSFCLGCGQHEARSGDFLCVSCLYHLPYTNHFNVSHNDFESHFIGRVPILHGAALLLYSEVVEQLIHLFKYQDMTKIGLKFGREIGSKIQATEGFNSCELIVPVPLHPSKKRKRGFNQSAIISEGIKASFGIPIDQKILVRKRKTESQTKKNRISRIQNLQSAFEVNRRLHQHNRHILLVDDVLTTGATLEACALALMRAGYQKISMVTLAMGQT